MPSAVVAASKRSYSPRSYSPPPVRSYSPHSSYSPRPSVAPPPPPPLNLNSMHTNLTTATIVQHGGGGGGGSHTRSHSPLLPSNAFYQPPPLNTYRNNSHYNLNTMNGNPQATNSGHNTVRSVKSYHTMNNEYSSTGGEQQFFTLSRSAVDITTDGKVLRLCTLVLDPNSPLPLDAEFGFDLVTKIGANQKIGDYFIDTVDEESPASVSGLKSGDRLLEVDGIDLANKTFEQVVQYINEAKVRGKLRLLVYPSIVINYGNPNVNNNISKSNINNSAATNSASNSGTYTNLSYADSRSMPDLNQQQLLNNQQQQQTEMAYYKQKQQIIDQQQHQHQMMMQSSKVVYKQKKSQQKQQQQQQHSKHDSNVSLSNGGNNPYTDYDSIYMKRNSQQSNQPASVSINGVTLTRTMANVNDNLGSNNSSRPGTM
jgi:hypothetical protein